jgi:hypothetical protein
LVLGEAQAAALCRIGRSQERQTDGQSRAEQAGRAAGSEGGEEFEGRAPLGVERVSEEELKGFAVDASAHAAFDPLYVMGKSHNYTCFDGEDQVVLFGTASLGLDER